MEQTVRKVAYAKVILPTGEALKREVVVFSPNGQPLSHFPLTEELPFVEWRDETYVFKVGI